MALGNQIPHGFRGVRSLENSRAGDRHVDTRCKGLMDVFGIDAAVDYEKGCYLGQEIVARLHFRGQVSQVVKRVVVAAGTPPAIGSEINHDGRSAGRLTGLGEPTPTGLIAGLAMVQRRAGEPGTRLETPDGVAVEILGPPTQD